MDVPFELRGGRIWTAVRIGGKELQVLFDTGSDGTAIDARVAESLELPLQEGAKGSTVAGDIELRKTGPLTFGLGDMHLAAEEVMVVPLAAQLPGADGLLGFDVLRHVPMTIDYDAKHIRLGALPPGERVPFLLKDDMRPSATVEALGGRFEACLDTGSAQGLSLPLEWVKRNAPRLLREETKREILGKTVSSQRFVVDRIRVGRTELKDAPAEAVTAEGGSFADSSRLWANVGNQVLSRFRVGLDGEQRLCVLDPVR